MFHYEIGLNGLFYIIIMRVYIDNYNPKNISVKALEKFSMHKKSYTKIFSAEGIFILENKRMYKLIPVFDSKIEPFYLDNIALLVDRSYTMREEHHQLPPKHIAKNMIQYEFKNSKVKLILEEYKSTIVQFYWELHSDESMENPMIQIEFSEFLSELK